MGRFAPKYPPEVKAELCRLVLDAKRRRTVPQAVAEIAESDGVEIGASSAYGYVRRERIRRSTGGDSPLPEDLHEALDLISRKMIVALGAEARRIIRAGRHGSKPLDVDRTRTVARTVRELRAGLELRGQSKASDRDESEAGERVPADNEAERLLAAHEADQEERARLEAEALERDEGPGQAGPIAGNGDTPVDVKAQAEIQAYVDRMAARRRLAP
jgi:hypothetical protein